MTPSKTVAWVCLALTVVLEVAATLLLRASDGFTVLVPSVLSVICYVGTVVVLSKALQVIPMSITYVVWTGAGTLGVVLLGLLIFHDQMTPGAWAGVGCVIVGVSVINAFPAPRTSEVASVASEEQSE